MDIDEVLSDLRQLTLAEVGVAAIACVVVWENAYRIFMALMALVFQWLE